MNRKIIETDIEQLSKTIKAMESEQERKLKQAVQQYNQVVQQNKDLQTERNIYRNALVEIQAIAGKSKNYSSTATKIYEKCAEVLQWKKK